MADVCEPLLFGEIEHIVEHCWEIVVAHLVEGELPELFPSRIENRVLPAVGVAPKVSHPHVVASVGKYEACRLVCVLMQISITPTALITQCLVSRSQHPVNRRAKQTVLEKNHRATAASPHPGDAKVTYVRISDAATCVEPGCNHRPW